ncbi:MAG: aminotransferase class I/II-fold pyridoxal phosphate-dependent enzyme [Enterobacteriaceae bacterium]
MTMKEHLSKRGQSYVRDMPPLVQAHFDTLSDVYHPVNNPQGHINMGTAETHLVNDEVIKLLHTVQNRMVLKAKNIHYDYFQGSLEFRTAIANYWQKLIFPPPSPRQISPDNIVIGAGCSLALEMLATVLGDPDDVALVPTPYYSGFVDDFTDRAKVYLVGVHSGSDLAKAPFETALAEQKKAGKRVRAVLFSSPNNPVGTVYTPEAINNLITFCMENDLDLISDEIYAQTIHDPQAKWHSTLSQVPDNYLHRVHVTSSFAKDFALSGFRTGFAISHNPFVLKAMQALAYYSAVSTHTQALLTDLLSAPELPAVLQTSRDRMRAGYQLIKNGLEQIGVETLPAQGGIFVFANFAPYLPQHEFAAEHVLWRKIYSELKINISPGQLFDAAEPGWFRVCYAHNPVVVEEACRRLSTLRNK